MCLCICICVYIYIYIYIERERYMYNYMYMYVYMCICVYMCIYIYRCIYIYIYNITRWRRLLDAALRQNGHLRTSTLAKSARPCECDKHSDHRIWISNNKTTGDFKFTSWETRGLQHRSCEFPILLPPRFSPVAAIRSEGLLRTQTKLCISVDSSSYVSSITITTMHDSCAWHGYIRAPVWVWQACRSPNQRLESSLCC